MAISMIPKIIQIHETFSDAFDNNNTETNTNDEEEREHANITGTTISNMIGCTSIENDDTILWYIYMNEASSQYYMTGKRR